MEIGKASKFFWAQLAMSSYEEGGAKNYIMFGLEGSQNIRHMRINLPIKIENSFTQMKGVLPH